MSSTKDLFKCIDLCISFGLDMHYLFWGFAWALAMRLLHIPKTCASFLPWQILTLSRSLPRLHGMCWNTALEREVGIGVRDYCIEADQERNRFHLMIELSPVETRRPDTEDLDMQQLSQTAERIFCRQFDSYAKARNTGEIAPVQVCLLEPETQLLYRDKCAVSQKCPEGQLKPVRILDTMEKSKFFHAFIVK